MMANISIRNLDDSIKAALQRRALAERCSMEEFLRRCLTQAAENPAKAAQALQVSAAPAMISAEGAAPGQDGGGQSRAEQRGAAAFAAGTALRGKTVLLIIGGSIAAYKALEVIRLLRRAGAAVPAVMTQAAQQFITPLAVGALTGGAVYSDLFSRAEEQDIGHIRLARQADLVLVLAATASRLAKMAAGQADDLAGAVLLATYAPVLLAPAMNPAMWAHRATRRNLAQLCQDGCRIIGPESGAMAESGEAGLGRMSAPAAILAAVAAAAAELPPPAAVSEYNAPQTAAQAEPAKSAALRGKHIIVTSGPTHEALDPVRYLANHSSGKQGHAVAAALARLGARVTLISGPVSLPDPPGAETVHINSAREMQAAALAALPADAAVFVAAVADWRPQYAAADKIKKPKIRVSAGGRQEAQALGPAENGVELGRGQIKISFVENPDILAEISRHSLRPRLVVGFAAETADLLENAAAKLAQKGADWIIANNVAVQPDGSGIMGGDSNHIHILSRSGVEDWPEMPKAQVAAKLAEKIAAFFAAD